MILLNTSSVLSNAFILNNLVNVTSLFRCTALVWDAFYTVLKLLQPLFLIILHVCLFFNPNHQDKCFSVLFLNKNAFYFTFSFLLFMLITLFYTKIRFSKVYR